MTPVAICLHKYIYITTTHFMEIVCDMMHCVILKIN